MRIFSVCVAFLAFGFIRLHAAEPIPALSADRLYALWTGEWTGVLEYRDTNRPTAEFPYRPRWPSRAQPMLRR